MSIQRDVSIINDDTQPVVVQPTLADPAPQAAFEAPQVVSTQAVDQPVRETLQVRSSMTISPAAIVGGVGAIVLLLFGAINLARAGLDGPMREPIVEVAGYQGTAMLGLIVLGAGVALLAASFSRDRGAILFVSIVLGVAAATVALEPSVGGDLVAVERDFGIAVLIIAVFVAFVAAVAPSVRRTSNRLERA
jgi:hypothetical protein